MKNPKILITNHQKKVKIPIGLRLLLRKCCNVVLETEKLQKNIIIDISFVDNEKIKELNKKYRNKDALTDVLSFPMDCCEKVKKQHGFQIDKVLLGDIVISLEKAFEQSLEYGHSLEREISYLTTHSVLHLLGYTHEKGGIEKLRMREKEENIMSKLGLNKNCIYVASEFTQKI